MQRALHNQDTNPKRRCVGKMKKFKQFVASLLAVIMVFGLMPVAALAEEPFIWSEQPAAEQPADEALEESAEPAIGEIAFDEGTTEDAQEVAAQAASIAASTRRASVLFPIITVSFL